MRQLPKTKNAQADKMLSSVIELISAYLIAQKNYTLYTRNHVIFETAFNHFTRILERLTKNYGEIRLDVDKDQLLFEENVVHQGQTNDNPAILFFRDGVTAIAFQQGVSQEEILLFFEIVNRYRRLGEVAGGDLVTALWEANLPHITYYTSETLWTDSPPIDFTLFKAAVDKPAPAGMTSQKGGLGGPWDSSDRRPDDAQKGDEETQSSASLDSDNVVSIATIDAGSELVRITEEELETIRHMVQEEENPELNEDVFDILVIILQDVHNQKDFKMILDYLREELVALILQSEFALADKCLVQLADVGNSPGQGETWQAEMVADYMQTVADPQTLSALEVVCPTLNVLDAERVKAFRQFAIRLHPRALLTLGPLVGQVVDLDLQDLICDVIAIQAKRDFALFLSLFEKLDTAQLHPKLVQVLSRFRSDMAQAVFLDMLHCSIPRIRLEGLKALKRSGFQTIEDLFDLIQDPNPSIRLLILDIIGQRKNATAENFMLDYLELTPWTVKDRTHMLACYHTLAKCGTDRSVAFLERMLFKKGWLPSAIQAIHRQGAAEALRIIGTNTTWDLLGKASKSLLPGIRAAYKKAIEG